MLFGAGRNSPCTTTRHNRCTIYELVGPRDPPRSIAASTRTADAAEILATAAFAIEVVSVTSAAGLFPIVVVSVAVTVKWLRVQCSIVMMSTQRQAEGSGA